MRFRIHDLLQAMFGVAFLTACIAGQGRGDDTAALRLAIVVQAVGIVAAGVRYAQERSRRYLVVMGVLGVLLVASGWMMIADWP
jgi:uncharacterized membrane protein (UPF0136 family)